MYLNDYISREYLNAAFHPYRVPSSDQLINCTINGKIYCFPQKNKLKRGIPLKELREILMLE